jgi:hypothetical protein
VDIYGLRICIYFSRIVDGDKTKEGIFEIIEKIKEIREMENDIETRPKLNSINFFITSSLEKKYTLN